MNHEFNYENNMNESPEVVTYNQKNKKIKRKKVQRHRQKIHYRRCKINKRSNRRKSRNRYNSSMRKLCANRRNRFEDPI